MKFLITCLHYNAISKWTELGQPAKAHLEDLSQSFKMVMDFAMNFSLLQCQTLKKHVDDNHPKFKRKKKRSQKKMTVSLQIEIKAKLIHMGSWKFTWTNAKTYCFTIFFQSSFFNYVVIFCCKWDETYCRWDFVP